ncbi:unnamed protein product [Somion occarium]|uniref:Uncharacterized protein n=1 Tax=Somion occarium TaxID=3059160 RepID=A0ABP1CHE0_9APHY
MSKTSESRPPGQEPVIPETVLDVPSQRLYYLSLGLLCQAIKVFDFFQHLFLGEPSNSSAYTRKWILVDSLYCSILAGLRIPRLRYTKSLVILQIVSLCLLDSFLFGSITLNLGIGGSWKVSPGVGLPGRSALPSTGQAFHFTDLIPSFGLSGLISSGGKDGHLLGQHTVRMSPISTGQLNPYLNTYCIASPGQSVLIPVLLNNTNPVNIRYTLTPLGYGAESTDKDKPKNGVVGKIDRVELSAKDLKAIEQARLETLQVAKVASAVKRNTEDYDEYDDDEEEEKTTPDLSSGFSLQKTQSMVHIRLNKPGVLRLERVMDSSGVEARLVSYTDLTIAPCPRAEFAGDGTLASGDDLRCAPSTLGAGGGEEIPLKINVYGVPPLSLRWLKEVNGKTEPFMVEGVESDAHIHAHSHDEGRRVANAGLRAPEQLSIPLTMTLDALGTHSYVLESVTDALGNTVAAGSHAPGDPSKITRSTTVLRRPAVSFKGCGPGNPAPLLIGSETFLTISAKDSDVQDAPWDITVKYRPTATEEQAKSSKKLKPWTQKFTTEDERKELLLRTSAPGEYMILGIKGRYCEGDVLSPETCKVVEKPLPTAEIEWKKIHECSGDIGVSASLVLHGTPPFQVYYSMKKDNEPARDLVKTFATSRGDLTIQPERSGHYTFTFLQLSDANYKKVALKGPSIDQVVHPPASADFARLPGPGGRAKRKISSCSGNTVDVNVELRGTGPWNLDVQVVGPKGSDIVRVENITTPQKTIQVPVPPTIDRDGGSFEIDLVSIEDAYGCKRSLSVPGITVNVRRVKPIAKFYGTKEMRRTTILEGEKAHLPLRLTGDGPWRLKYRLTEQPDRIRTATLYNPNDELLVSEKGVYEIIEIADSQCPGSVVSEASTYQVDWVPRPVAKLSSEVQATYEPHNGSHILPAICEGLPDHVDLDLTGKPPFQIMYNIAKDAENGGTKILDQPTFSSIQPRTRFQLRTGEAGRIYYEVKQIGDASYPLAKNKQAIIPRSERLLFEQQVLMRPSARFKTNNRISYCMNDALTPHTPHDISSADGVILLEGTPPFRLAVSIWNRAASETHKEILELNDHVWRLNLANYTFKSIGPHLVTIESIQDASHCAQTAADPNFKSVWIDVAETAAIVPFDRREHYCVGDVTQFQLEGTPPWTIGYRVNGKSHTQEVKTSPFAIVQEQPGEFAITSIAHQHKMCKTAVTDLRYTVHPLPAAQVGHGKRIIQDIHEGDQAEIVFTLIGDPPFTFTYQRTELVTKKGAQGKVLETHTVSGVTTREYSIFSALEGTTYDYEFSWNGCSLTSFVGTWTVTFISDRYCRYPPVQDGSMEKSR